MPCYEVISFVEFQKVATEAQRHGDRKRGGRGRTGEGEHEKSVGNQSWENYFVPQFGIRQR